MGSEHRRRAAALTAAVAVLAGAGTVRAAAQLLPPLGPSQQQSTTTTAPPVVPPVPLVPETTVPPPAPPAEEAPPTDTTPPAEEPPADTAEPSPTPADPGEGAEGGVGGIVPPDAQAIINSIARSAPGDNQALVDGAAALEAAGVPHDDAVREVFGPFPVLGLARWSDDWYMPRWTGSLFRFHLGLDILADYGTPLAAPADGIARIGQSELGGLSVSVVEPDGTFWYLAHLAGLADGLVDGTSVTVGQIVGFVGTSGNAAGGPAHLHFAVHPRGGEPVPPKPIVDQWVADGAARVGELLAAAAAPRSAAVVATDLTRRLADGVFAGPAASGPPRSELLWASAASPTGGAVAVAEATAASLSESVDWARRGAQQRSLDLAWSQAVGRAQQLLAPLVHPTLRAALEQRRAATPS